MWGKKKAANDFGTFATNALMQMMEGVYSTGVAPDAVRPTDELLHGYAGQGVKWEHVWASAAQRYEPALGAMLNFDAAYKYAGGRTTVLQFGTKPYWDSSPSESQGIAPVSVLAFLGSPHRMKLAESPRTDPDVLDLIAGGQGRPGDAHGIVATAAFMNLVKRGFREIPRPRF